VVVYNCSKFPFNLKSFTTGGRKLSLSLLIAPNRIPFYGSHLEKLYTMLHEIGSYFHSARISKVSVSCADALSRIRTVKFKFKFKESQSTTEKGSLLVG